jgi:hypothetical protein
VRAAHRRVDGRPAGRPKIGSQADPISKAPSLEEAGIDKNLAHRARERTDHRHATDSLVRAIVRIVKRRLVRIGQGTKVARRAGAFASRHGMFQEVPPGRIVGGALAVGIGHIQNGFDIGPDLLCHAWLVVPDRLDAALDGSEVNGPDAEAACRAFLSPLRR